MPRPLTQRIARTLWFCAIVAAACSSNTQNVVLSVTEEDNGVTFGMPVGARVTVTLPATYEWSLTPSVPSGFELITEAQSEREVEWLLEARRSGSGDFVASGVPRCRSAQPPCSAPDRTFTAHFEVE